MAQAQNVTEAFSSFQQYLNEEQDVREEIRVVVRDLEQKTREILAVLQGIHQPDGVKQLSEICKKARGCLVDIRQLFDSLKEKVPKDQYYRFHDHWRFCIQRLSFLAALIVYLETEALITQTETAETLGVAAQKEDGFHLELDDYLMGLLQMASELINLHWKPPSNNPSNRAFTDDVKFQSRLAVNAVTSGDYSRPIRIASFVGELDSGFRLLNLKNDSLRKKFDGLKYDLKKVEEVVYDVTIRGLRPDGVSADPASS
ncbi:hypothetical protein LSH36_935g00015 [Paralvinella palmiformis]|uniref:Translin n=1 Tax=Paralvinella palmiformis TaxID=53620 RepID=A0AAD9IXW7_9ANNE|nr:hypothetical protein LSH36_935g00015 [Paralvinella palmiformis]